MKVNPPEGIATEDTLELIGEEPMTAAEHAECDTVPVRRLSKFTLYRQVEGTTVWKTCPVIGVEEEGGEFCGLARAVRIDEDNVQQLDGNVGAKSYDEEEDNEEEEEEEEEEDENDDGKDSGENAGSAKMKKTKTVKFSEEDEADDAVLMKSSMIFFWEPEKSEDNIT
jgi:hypothetical protein